MGGVVPPQGHRDPDDSEPGNDDRPRLGTQPLKPLRVEIYRAKACRHRDDPAPVGACGPDSDSDHENGPGDGENPARHVRAAFSQAWRAVPEPILPTAQP